MLSLQDTIIFTCVMGAVIFFCRIFPFIFFQARKNAAKPAQDWASVLVGLVEKVAPPVAMTVLAFNALSAPFKEDVHQGFPALLAATFTALVHWWKRNSLLSIFGGTAVFMILSRVIRW
jgi:branched-subunit amino acid transport protein AzlD